MSYLKTSQTKSTQVKKKHCPLCNKNRDMKFFSSTRAKSCTDCKLKKWRVARKNRPAAVQKRSITDWAIRVKVRDGYKCCYCGATEYLNSHHIFSRSNKNVVTDLDNGITLCAKHHTFSTEFSAHKTPTEFTLWLMKRNGNEWFEELTRKAHTITKSVNTLTQKESK